MQQVPSQHFWACLWHVSRWDWHWDQWPQWSRQPPIASRQHPANLLRATKRTKSRGREDSVPSCPLKLGHWPSHALGLGLTPLSSLGLRPLDLDWYYTTGFPRCPTCRQQNMGLISLHNHMSQCFTINHIYHIGDYIYVCIYICYWFCFSGQPWLIWAVSILWVKQHVSQLLQHIQCLQGFYILQEKSQMYLFLINTEQQFGSPQSYPETRSGCAK